MTREASKRSSERKITQADRLREAQREIERLELALTRATQELAATRRAWPGASLVKRSVRSAHECDPERTGRIIRRDLHDLGELALDVAYRLALLALVLCPVFALVAFWWWLT